MAFRRSWSSQGLGPVFQSQVAGADATGGGPPGSAFRIDQTNINQTTTNTNLKRGLGWLQLAL